MAKIEPRNHNGSILLRFQLNGQKYAFNPIKGGKWNDSRDRARATLIAGQIKDDIKDGSFDKTLSKYKVTGKSTEIPISDAERVKHANLFDLFSEFTAFKKRRLKSNSMIDFRTVLNKLKKCPYKSTKNAMEITEWLVGINEGKSDNSLIKHYTLISACCDWGVTSKRLTSNPFKDLRGLIPAKKEEKLIEDINPFDRDETNRIIQAFKEDSKYLHFAPLVEFMFAVGCRPGEAIGLQWKHINGNKVVFQQVITIGGKVQPGLKNKQKRRAITIDDHVLSVIKSNRKTNYKPDDYVFTGKQGGIVDWHNFSTRAWKKVLKSLDGIEYRSPYHMRHSAITRMIKDDIDIAKVARLVGNSPAVIHKHYLGDVSDIVIPPINAIAS